MGGHTFGREQSHLTDNPANACFLIYLAVASPGLPSEWVPIHSASRAVTADEKK